ncbi:MAG: hypothetical protein KatS3mg011_1015 [Acidimicrobiia bacterium]|nr:MAG: hypothetical protein KatS3mg011_1015 [Acidimicrobiia bacterium]
MARRSRQRRIPVPGVERHRPSPEDRARDHRKVRHQTRQILTTVTDPDEVGPLPEVKPKTVVDHLPEVPPPPKRRFRVWKTKFWKRRRAYRDMKAKLDARWAELMEDDAEDW